MVPKVSSVRIVLIHSMLKGCRVVSPVGRTPLHCVNAELTGWVSETSQNVTHIPRLVRSSIVE